MSNSQFFINDNVLMNSTDIDPRFIVNNDDLLIDDHYEISYEQDNIVSLDDILPQYETWQLPDLYIEDQNGGIRLWRISYDGNQLIRTHGYALTPNAQKGKLQVDRSDIVLNNRSISKLAQAWQEAKQYYIIKYRNGYRPALDNTEKLVIQLGHPLIDKKTGKWRLNDNHFKSGVSCQGKIDGFRASIWPDKMTFISRGNKTYKWLQHIKDELLILFSYLPENVGLDGELYNPTLNFHQLSTAIKTENYQHSNNKLIYYYIFDIIVYETTLNDRIKILNDAYQAYLKDGYQTKTFFILPQYPAYNREQLIGYFNYFIENQYEGMIIRKLVGLNPSEKEKKESYYRGKKNNNLLKMKRFYDDEGLIVGIDEASGRDIGTAILIIEWQGHRFKCRPGEKLEIRKKWFQNPENIIGKIYTFTYFEILPSGLPRFPTGKYLRDDEFKTGADKIIDIKSNNGVAIFILAHIINSQIYQIECIPSGDAIDHQQFINNKIEYIMRIYIYRYLDLDENGIPMKLIGYKFAD